MSNPQDDLSLSAVSLHDQMAQTPQGRYGLGKRVEYRVKRVDRFIVTAWEKDIEPPGYGSSGGSPTVAGGGAVYENFETAYAVAYALCKAKHEWLGYLPGDERVQYPNPNPPGTVLSLDPSFHDPEEIASLGQVIVNDDGREESLTYPA